MLFQINRDQKQSKERPEPSIGNAAPILPELADVPRIPSPEKIPVAAVARGFHAAEKIGNNVRKEEVPASLIADVLVDVLVGTRAVAVIFRGGNDKDR